MTCSHGFQLWRMAWTDIWLVGGQRLGCLYREFAELATNSITFAKHNNWQKKHFPFLPVQKIIFTKRTVTLLSNFTQMITLNLAKYVSGGSRLIWPSWCFASNNISWYMYPSEQNSGQDFICAVKDKAPMHIKSPLWIN